MKVNVCINKRRAIALGIEPQGTHEIDIDLASLSEEGPHADRSGGRISGRGLPCAVVE